MCVCMYMHILYRRAGNFAWIIMIETTRAQKHLTRFRASKFPMCSHMIIPLVMNFDVSLYRASDSHVIRTFITSSLVRT